MKNTMPLKSSTNSPRPNRAEAASSLPDAVASSSQPTPVPSIPASMVGPKPRRWLRRSIAAVAPSEPMPASIHSAPTRPALKPSSRAAYSTTIASEACRKICHTEIAQADLGVRFDQIAAPDPFGHEDLISRPAANGSKADEESDRIEHPHGERIEPRVNRHGEQGQGARDVRPYDDRKLGRAVHQHAGEQAEERERQRLERREDAHFERRRIEQQGAGERQREEGDLPAEVGDGERAPQPHEIAVAPQPVERSGGIQSSK